MTSDRTRSAERSSARAAAAAVAGRLGADGRGLEHIAEGTTSTVFRLPARQVVLVVASPGVSSARLRARVELAAALAERASFVRPEPAVDQPVAARGRLVTVWQEVRGPGAATDWRALGRAVRALHSVPASALPLPDTLPGAHDVPLLEREIRELVDTGRVASTTAADLLVAAGRLSEELAGLGAERVLVHGDLHAANILSDPHGVVLCDTDELAWGHRDYDLGFLVDPGRPTLVDQPARRAFEAGYGEALPDAARARTMSRLCHLRRTVRLLGEPDGGVRERWYSRVRLASWAAMVDDWSRDLQPVVAQSRVTQVLVAARHARGRHLRRHPGQGTAAPTRAAERRPPQPAPPDDDARDAHEEAPDARRGAQ